MPTTRRVPRWADVAPFLVTRPWSGDPVVRRLARCVCVDDLAREARRRVPRAVLDYVETGAEGERSLRRNRAAYDALELRPSSFATVAAPDTRTTVLGRPAGAPIVLAPTGYTRLSHHEGECAAAASAAAAGLPYTLSTYATTSIADVAAAAPTGRNWFQLYLMKDRDVSLEHLRQARSAGYEALMLTVDTALSGAKWQDRRNGFSIPPALTVRTLADLARRPRWVADILTTDPLRFATFPEDSAYARWGMSNTLREQALRQADVTWLKEQWQGPVVVKGVLSVADAVTAVDAGADAVVVSNHGGRQLDRAPVPLEVLPAVVDAVGDRAEVMLDSGIRTGSDVAAAVALGATAVLVGRAYLYGLMVGGRRGVDTALGFLTDELAHTMALLGAPTVADLHPGHVALRSAS
jgi:L-lactate dehydrogenase (cytochrome)